MSPHYSDIQIRKVLRNLGFSDNEIKVLNFLFHKKKSSIKTISRHTALAYNSTRFALENLKFRNLVMSFSNDVFEICDEQSFLQWVDHQEEKYAHLYEQTNTDIQDFFTLIQESIWKPGVLYYEGIDGIRSIYDDILQTGETIYAWTDLSNTYFSLGPFMDEFIQNRIEKGIKMVVICPHNYNESMIRDDEQKLREVAISQAPSLNGEVRIYGDKVAVMTFDKDLPVGFVFQGRVITDLFKTLFQDYWKLAKKII